MFGTRLIILSANITPFTANLKQIDLLRNSNKIYEMVCGKNTSPGIPI
jgi:hypothetical protein